MYPLFYRPMTNVMQEDKEECLEAGMNDYLSKPVNRDDLAQLLKKWASGVFNGRWRA